MTYWQLEQIALYAHINKVNILDIAEMFSRPDLELSTVEKTE
jgi:hypothetical protein